MDNLQKKRILNFRPFLFIAVAIFSGILFAYFKFFDNLIMSFVIFSLFVIFNLIYLIFSKDNFRILGRIIFVVVCALIFILGANIFTYKVEKYKDDNLNNMYLEVSGVVKEVAENEGSQKIVLTDISVKGTVTKTLDYDMNVYINAGTVKVGDVISFSSSVSDYGITYGQRFSSGNIVDGVKYFANVDSSNVVVGEGNLNLFEKVKLFIASALKEGLNLEEYQIAYSLLLGKSDAIDDNVLQPFRNTGVAHIFAVSGLHIGFMAMAITFILKTLKVNKYIRALITFILLLFYSGVCSFTASSIRAVIMYTVFMLSDLSGKKYDFCSSVSLAFIIILLFSPVQLFCIGFQLSFLAVIGIMLFSNTLNRVLKFLPSKIANIFSASISAQVFTLPVLMYNFKSVSLISLFVNLVFVPLVSVIFIMLFLLTFLGGICSAPKIFLFVPSYVLKAVKIVIEFFDKNFFLVSVTLIGVSIIIYYVAFLIFSNIINLKKKFRFITASVLICSFIIINVIGGIYENKLTKITAIANDSIYSTVVEDDGKITVVVNKVNEYFMPNKLKNYIGENEIENLIIADEIFGNNLHIVITKFNYYFNLKNVFVYDESDINIYNAMFNGINFYAIEDGNIIEFSDTKIIFYRSSNAVKITKNEKNVLLLSKFIGDDDAYKEIACENQLKVYTEYSLALNNLLKGDKFIEYGRESHGYSCILDGNYTIKI